MDDLIADLGRRVLGGELLGAEKLLELSDRAQDSPCDLFYWASRIREAYFGNRVHLCSIVAGKLGGCGEDCKWCAQSAAAPGVTKPRRTSLAQVVSAADSAEKSRAACLGIVNSGRGPSDRDIDDVVAAAEAIVRDPGRNLRLCASLGQLSPGQAARLAAAGIGRYNHNLETSRRLFAAMVTTHSYDDRLRTLAAARDAGLELCCGCLFGLGETWTDRIELAIELRDAVRPDVVPLNFLTAIPGTPLAGVSPLSPIEILTIVAVFRFAMPTIPTKVAGGREANLRSMQSWMFFAGATGCIVGDYLTTAGLSSDEDLAMIADLGLQPAAIEALRAQPTPSVSR